jgi:Domain of unknown function (DUF4136)
MARFASSFLVTLIGCAVIHGQNVITNYAPGTDFSKYRTYKWVPIERAGQPNQIVDAEIKQSIDSQLARKGFTTANIVFGTVRPSSSSTPRKYWTSWQELPALSSSRFEYRTAPDGVMTVQNT